ncbi:MAG: hypothetical protein HQL31_13830 [Planctomycetes bacterium]|nr:hypothetical protein [Planctomycetota bacterium]
MSTTSRSALIALAAIGFSSVVFADIFAQKESNGKDSSSSVIGRDQRNREKMSTEKEYWERFKAKRDASKNIESGGPVGTKQTPDAHLQDDGEVFQDLSQIEQAYYITKRQAIMARRNRTKRFNSYVKSRSLAEKLEDIKDSIDKAESTLSAHWATRSEKQLANDHLANLRKNMAEVEETIKSMEHEEKLAFKTRTKQIARENQNMSPEKEISLIERWNTASEREKAKLKKRYDPNQGEEFDQDSGEIKP